MRRFAAVILAMSLSGCAELEELLVGDSYDEWYVEPAPVVYQSPAPMPPPTIAPPTAVPPLASTPRVVPVTPAVFSGTTPEPETIAPKK